VERGDATLVAPAALPGPEPARGPEIRRGEFDDAMTRPGPLILLGLDALEARELEPRLADGRLPNLQRLLRSRAWRRVEPDVPGFPDGVWRSFVNGLPVGEHGWYFLKQWRPEHGCVERSATSWLRLQPFWEELAAAGARLAILDVPQAPAPGPDFPGVYLTGWQTHDPEEPRSQPASLLAELEHRFGQQKLPREVYGPQRPGSLLELHGAAVAAVRQFSDILLWLIRQERFDLVAAVFGSAHRVGHYLWDLSQVDGGQLSERERSQLAVALDDVYVALDTAVGRIEAALPADATLAVFALHGMGPNAGWTELVPEILPRLPGARTVKTRTGWRGRINRLRRAPAVMRASQMLPRPVTRLLGSAWTSRMHDWSTTRAFALPAELGGLVRVNLAGRDRHGIVEPGPACDDLLATLEDSLRRITVLDDDQPLVDAVHHPPRIVGEDARYRQYLPDLVVEWREVSLTASTGVRLPDGDTLRWARGRRLTSGRSGNHRTAGWLIADRDFVGDAPTVIDLPQAVAAHFGLALGARSDERQAGERAGRQPQVVGHGAAPPRSAGQTASGRAGSPA
jgi:predicted AlkP superfamily phosphohydrolase/phosphomutase